MSIRLRIDRISVDAGALPPGGEAAFRRQLETRLRQQLETGEASPSAGASAVDRVAATIHAQVQGRMA